MNSTSIIRERGQLTIPKSIRRVINWVTPMSAVSISVTKPDEIWKKIQKSRAIRGKGPVNATKLLTRDRKSH